MLIYFLLSFILSLVLSFATLKFCERFRIFDRGGEDRKIHQNPTPNIGGIAFFVAFWISLATFILVNDMQGFYLKYLVGIFIGSLLLVTVGIIDDVKKVSPYSKFIAQGFSALIVIASGIGITSINSPLGGIIHLDQINFLVNISGSLYKITLIADILAFLWIVGMINAMNFLDGLDGLAAGVSSIAFFVVFLLSLSPSVEQPLSAIIALVAFGSVVAFLPFNTNPAKIFMGDTGSMFLGFLLAVLAIVSGGKLATALLVFGLPVFDSIWVAVQRTLKGKKPWEAGRDHLHHKLMKLGMSQRNVVMVFWAITALFGVVSLLGGAREKFIALIILVILMIMGMGVINVKLKMSNVKG